ncbi:MAG TPA: hypothetical protein P5277_00045 [Candidatus Paceibacterota bacterium]|nr:hypothetical protein [Candidatus Paceibacterota bacterium]
MFDKLTGLVVDNIQNITNVNADALILASFISTFVLMLFILFFILFIAIYVYSSLALMKIAQKTKTKNAWLAWIPIGNNYLTSKIAKMHWWPLLSGILGFIVFILGFFTLINSFDKLNTLLVILSCLLIFIGICLIIIFIVFSYIWMWKMFEAVKRPGWWVLLSLVPYVGGILMLIFLGIAAWGKPGK